MNIKNKGENDFKSSNLSSFSARYGALGSAIGSSLNAIALLYAPPMLLENTETASLISLRIFMILLAAALSGAVIGFVIYGAAGWLTQRLLRHNELTIPNKYWRWLVVSWAAIIPIVGIMLFVGFLMYGLIFHPSGDDFQANTLGDALGFAFAAGAGELVKIVMGFMAGLFGILIAGLLFAISLALYVRRLYRPITIPRLLALGSIWLISSSAAACGIYFGGVSMIPGAQKQKIQCSPISSLPFIISKSGRYCLEKDLKTTMTSGNAIKVDADNVVIDLKRRVLDGLGAGLGTRANGIRAIGRTNITIRNGRIRGFFAAIRLNNLPDTPTHHLIDEVYVSRSTVYGIWLDGLGNNIQQNTIMKTGGSTGRGFGAYGIFIRGQKIQIVDNNIHYVTGEGAFTKKGMWQGGSYGIEVRGREATVLNNNILGVTEKGTFAAGIHLLAADRSLIKNNRIIAVYAPEDKTGIARSTGIDIETGKNVTVQNNQIISSIGKGISFLGGKHTNGGIYSDNTIIDSAVPFTRGVNGRGNLAFCHKSDPPNCVNLEFMYPNRISENN
jgi:Right handed beta helix region